MNQIIMEVKRKAKKEEWEKLLISIIVGLVAAIGIFAAFAVWTGSDMLLWNKTLALGLYFLLAGGIAGSVFLS